MSTALQFKVNTGSKPALECGGDQAAEVWTPGSPWSPADFGRGRRPKLHISLHATSRHKAIDRVRPDV
jgi:hypothetical protein